MSGIDSFLDSTHEHSAMEYLQVKTGYSDDSFDDMTEKGGTPVRHTHKPRAAAESPSHISDVEDDIAEDLGENPSIDRVLEQYERKRGTTAARKSTLDNSYGSVDYDTYGVAEKHRPDLSVSYATTATNLRYSTTHALAAVGLHAAVLVVPAARACINAIQTHFVFWRAQCGPRCRRGHCAAAASMTLLSGTVAAVRNRGTTPLTAGRQSAVAVISGTRYARERRKTTATRSPRRHHRLQRRPNAAAACCKASGDKAADDYGSAAAPAGATDGSGARILTQPQPQPQHAATHLLPPPTLAG